MSESALDNQPDLAWDGTHMIEAFRAAEQWLKQHVPVINSLNVFPVPDGDTGTNMHLTLSAALYGVSPAASCALVAEQIYRGALMGARGNSGVFLSQILYGLAQGLKDHEICGPAELAHALERASITAYSSASEPREGTILTVIRETSRAAHEALLHTGADLRAVLAAAVDGARASVERTPTLLKVLHDAGVVDAGGQGLYVILEGMLRWVQGDSEPLQAPPAADAEHSLLARVADEHDDEFGYCTNLLLQGEALPVEGIRGHMDAVGTSVAVVGDDRLLRIHVHTLRPGDILNYAMQYGELLRVEIANMDQQRAELRRHAATHEAPAADAAQSAPAPVGEIGRVGVVAVAVGEGFDDIFRSLGVGAMVMGGQTMNPSTQELLEVINSLPQDEIVVLPNNSNILLAAQQAAKLSSKRVEVLPSRTIPQGIAAMVRFVPSYDLEANTAAMQQELAHVTTIEFTTAVRNAQVSGKQVQAGQVMALLDGELAAVGEDFEQVIGAVLTGMDIDTYEHLTIYYGQDVPRKRAQMLAAQLEEQYPDHIIELRCGGQPVYSYILAAE
jgi:hypothetical protein